ncbi:MAG: hypothetical protein AAB297_08815, partial [Acidobacteriota bacterium]
APTVEDARKELGPGLAPVPAGTIWGRETVMPVRAAPEGPLPWDPEGRARTPGVNRATPRGGEGVVPPGRAAIGRTDVTTIEGPPDTSEGRPAGRGDTEGDEVFGREALRRAAVRADR